MPPLPSGPLIALRHLIGVKAGARDDALRLDRPSTRLHDESRLRLAPRKHFSFEVNLGAALFDLGGESAADHRVVDDPGVEHVQRGNTGDVRLQLAQPLDPDHLGADAVQLAASFELGEARPIVVIERDHDLAAHCVLDLVLPAVLDHRRAAGAAELGLVGARLVVDAGVDHAGVAPALMGRDRTFLLDHHDGPAGM